MHVATETAMEMMVSVRMAVDIHATITTTWFTLDTISSNIYTNIIISLQLNHVVGDHLFFVIVVITFRWIFLTRERSKSSTNASSLSILWDHSLMMNHVKNLMGQSHTHQT